MGRDVFAVPGPIGRSTSDGTNRLIRDGAMIVTGVEDILSELGIPARGVEADTAGSGPRSEPARSIWAALASGPLHVDEVACSAGVESAAVLQALLDLEIAGHVRQFPGMRFGLVP
jgi:DNA processing protein